MKLEKDDSIEVCDFDVMEEFIAPMQNTLQALLCAYVKEVDKTSLEAFAKYGYTREWLLDPNNRDRIHITGIGNRYYTYTIDGVDLFTLTSRPMIDDADQYKFSVNIVVEYIAPLPEEGSDENKT